MQTNRPHDMGYQNEPNSLGIKSNNAFDSLPQHSDLDFYQVNESFRVGNGFDAKNNCNYEYIPVTCQSREFEFADIPATFRSKADNLGVITQRSTYATKFDSKNTQASLQLANSPELEMMFTDLQANFRHEPKQLNDNLFNQYPCQVSYNTGDKHEITEYMIQPTNAIPFNSKPVKRLYNNDDYTHNTHTEKTPGPVNMATLRSLSFKPREEKGMSFNDKVRKWLAGVSSGETVVMMSEYNYLPITRIMKPYPTVPSEPDSDNEKNDGMVDASGGYGYMYGLCFDDDISEFSEDGRQEKSCRVATRNVLTAYRNELQKSKSLKQISIIPSSIRNSSYFTPRKNSTRSLLKIKTGSIYSKITKSDSQSSPSSLLRDGKREKSGNDEFYGNKVDEFAAAVTNGCGCVGAEMQGLCKVHTQNSLSNPGFKKTSGFTSDYNMPNNSSANKGPELANNLYYSTEIGSHLRKHYI